MQRRFLGLRRKLTHQPRCAANLLNLKGIVKTIAQGRIKPEQSAI
jgi:hypothetical protein